ncbi:hypothetical protein JG687_00016476 [Phytophthora cactorum]|uniref:BED-type domain-containing protein n=1 Tax=Phytophthora cactorum TaxID=29920 RepID=A0A329S008_9STRA|nr:hypothetical protein PC111_g22621 [Phytophthora cactorum]KAG2796922.1 hypothetical protein PC112_g22007 [Phytophthora cactorum]KAG2969194.1 hypothetical protein PC119_g23995 [Phytophthora cactorum]KAG3054222.1 hypothetical protein PC122_g22099 [Phytophthora cactorum]KAG3138408.1 hypothetical protein PC128_g25572 [Phytophthora cactorum]
MAPTPSQHIRILFTKVPSGRYKCCLCSNTRKLAASDGYTNTVEHLRRGPAASHYLGQASVVKAPDFESGLVKVISGKEKKLIQAKTARVEPSSSCRNPPTNSSSTAKLSFADRLLQSDSKTVSRCIDLRLIPSTSNDN